MPTSRRIVDSSGEDFYPTPAWATEALLDNEEFFGSIWEPACGNGAISEVLKKKIVSEVFSTDLYDRGYGDQTKIDFIQASKALKTHNIITNPPYNLAEEFVHKGLELCSLKLALLLRLSFLESASRFRSIFSQKPPSRVWVFSERITFYPNGVQTGGTGTLAYGWFVWDRSNRSEKTELKWLPPKYKTDKPDPVPREELKLEL